ncbi:MAG: uroporphyrinogen decarboxylase family protein [Verrucomicrobiota bacterium]
MSIKRKWSKHSDLAIQRNPIMEREEFLDWMTFKGGNRIPFTEIFGPIIGLKEEWEEQGASSEELDFSAFQYRAPKKANIAVGNGRLGKEQWQTEETDDSIYYEDDLGRTLRLAKNASTIPLPLTYPVSNMDDWLKIKPKYEYSEERFGDNWQEKAEAARDEGAAVQVSIPGGFDEPRQLLGEENLCYAYFEQPELIHDILDTIGETACRVLDKVSREVQIDILSVHEDMAGKSGPLAGPKQIEEFIKPYYRRVWDMLADRGVRLFDQDSDGDMNHVIQVFIDSGVNCMHPMEPAANMDIVQIREKFGEKLSFYGGIDKHVLRRSHDEIESELEYKIPPMIRTRGCMVGLDHRIPNGTPLENYRFYIRKVWEIIEREEGKV